jgi:hypothetical protein
MHMSLFHGRIQLEYIDALCSLSKPFKHRSAVFSDDHIVAACRAHHLPTFRRNIFYSFKKIDNEHAAGSRDVSASPPFTAQPAPAFAPIDPHPKALLHSGNSAFHTYAPASIEATSESKSSETFVPPALPAAPLTPITAHPQEPPRSDATVQPQATESSALLCSDMPESKELVSAGVSGSSEGVPALVIDGIPGNFSEKSVEGALDSFFVSFAAKNGLLPPHTCAVRLISKDRSSGKVVMALNSSCTRYHITEDVCNDLASSLGAVRLHRIIINCFPSLLVGTAAFKQFPHSCSDIRMEAPCLQVARR